MKFPIVDLPEYYCGLLKLNIPSIDRAISIVPSYIENHHHLKFLIKKYFKDVHKQGHVGPILKSMGWQNFRNRLCSLFIYRQANGHYPENLSTDFSTGVCTFERKLKNYSVNGFNRAYMFGLYLKMARIYTNSSEDFNFLNISPDVISLLKYTKARVIRIDWLLMLLIHFSDFLGKEELKTELKKGTGFKVLMKSLSVEEKNLLVDNMLAYGASINEPDTFASKHV